MKPNLQQMIAEAGTKPSTLPAALVKAQSMMGHAVLDAKNPHFKSRYATLQSVIDAVKPALNACGIAFYQRTEMGQGCVIVETVFLHESGETLTTGPLPVPAAPTAHGIGSALTYAKRYSLAMACGIGSDEDDDGSVATEQARKGTGVIAAVMETGGAKFDPVKRDAVVELIDQCFTDDPETGLVLVNPEGLDELLQSVDADMKIGIWQKLPAKVKRFIRERAQA
jgi:hypothetical protein